MAVAQALYSPKAISTMNSIRQLSLLVFLLFSAVTGGCAECQITLKDPLSGPHLLHFGAHISIEGHNIPVHGEFQLTAEDGLLIVMLPHGSILGQCYFEPQHDTDVRYHLNCTSSTPSSEIRKLLENIGIGLYRLCSIHDRESLPAKIKTSDWQAQCKVKSSSSWYCQYEEKSFSIDFSITEF